jgi:hypothetical protein
MFAALAREARDGRERGRALRKQFGGLTPRGFAPQAIGAVRPARELGAQCEAT